MHQPLVFHVSAVSRVAPYLGIAAILVGGAVLILSSVNLRARAIARRVDMVQPRPGDVEAGPKPPAERDEYQFKDGTQGLSVPEQRQIARFFAAYDVPPDPAILYFTLFRLCAIVTFAGIAYLAASRMTWPLPS